MTILVYLSVGQIEVVLSLIAVIDIENITIEYTYTALDICIYIPWERDVALW